MADYTPTTWARELLRRLGVPVSTGNVSALVAWETAEGGHWHNVDKYNPLNTSQSAPGARSTNSAGIKAYTSWEQGLQATIATLRNGRYGGILSALTRGTDPDAVKRAIIASPWGTKRIGDVAGGGQLDPAAAAAAGSTAPGAVVPVGWHIPGTPWDLPTPGDAIGGVEGAAAGISRTLTRVGILAPIVIGGALLIVLGGARATKRTRPKGDNA